MTYEGPEAEDYENVRLLNIAYLTQFRSNQNLRAQTERLPADLRYRLLNLSALQTEYLAEVPFLLFSLRPADEDYWSAVFQDSEEAELFAVKTEQEMQTLQSAALGFAWQMAQRNPYTARLLCFASVSWCEMMADTAFYQLLARTELLGNPICFLAPESAEFWRKLLSDGIHEDTKVRRAAHIAALQLLLTEQTESHSRQQLRAARSMEASALRVADWAPS